MSGAVSLMLCAGEPSGDALGAALASALRQVDPDIILSGCGGPAMAAAGIDSLFDISPLSVFGPFDAAKAAPTAFKGARLLADHAAATGVDGAVMIDSGAFSGLVAGALTKRAPSVKRYKYVAPQVWASRPHRAKTIAEKFDGVLTLFSFEPEWFVREGAQAECVGHSGFQALREKPGDGAAFRAAHGLGERPIVLLAPGSRSGEIHRLTPYFRAAIDNARSQIPDLAIIIPAAPGRDDMVRAAFADWSVSPLIVGPDARYDAYAAASLGQSAGLIASGTVSTELALSGAPMIVAYQVGPIAAMYGRMVITTDYASLINIACGAEVIPEFIQDDCTVDNLTNALVELLTNQAARDRQLSAFPKAFEALGAFGAPAAQKAAHVLLNWLKADAPALASQQDAP